ncbi:energy-coupling factor ABC transporter ATP-binding protein [Paenibacillus hamazuiensis]|uniref:energy-coupling factor ABC transporter ATP-binding protein n=1 Tax=Paenibacillus hamazuiensis TaxID=2936508 RepID=UPI00201029E8|nr:ABC transporter ATP-binding protein [Paenibacillus hamazuiensis]
MKSILEARSVSFSYPGSEHEALCGLTMCIPAGKKIAICGHNGCGKSTFFLHAVGIHRPVSGELLWNGSPIVYHPAGLKQLRQQIGLVFQDPEHQLILNTPFEDVSYGLRNAGMPEQEISVRTQNMLASMNLGHLAGTPIHHLSLGQKKRVALAGVLALEPELLLLDEPTAYLDRVSEHKLVEELNRIHANGITIVMATHDMNLAYSWADWVFVMDQGKCLAEGPPSEVFAREEQILSLGMELPLLLELWKALPKTVRMEALPPRSLAEFKLLMEKMQ